MNLRDLIPGRRKRQQETADGKRQAAITTRREAAAEPVIRESVSLAARLRAHNDQNHYAQRAHAAFLRSHG